MKIAQLICLLCFPVLSFAEVAEFSEEFEKDFPLRSIGTLEVNNLKGDIQIQPWSLDKIRIKAVKQVRAESPELAKKAMEKIDFTLKTVDRRHDVVEATTQYSSELSIGERLRETEKPTIKMNWVIQASSRLKLKIWTPEGQVAVKNWSQNIEIRTRKGPISLENAYADQVKVICETCTIRLERLKSDVHCTVKKGTVELKDIEGSSLYTELADGTIQSTRVKADQVYVLKQGLLLGHALSGKVHFQTQKARVNLKRMSGHLGGQSQSGDIWISYQDRSFPDETLIESQTGNIELNLPWQFAGPILFKSRTGKIETEFPILPAPSQPSSSLQTGNFRNGRIRDGGQFLRIATEAGNIHVRRSPL